MIFDSDSSDSVSCFCDGSRKGVDGASLKRKKETIQLASVRNKAVCFREQSNYNRRQRKLANFLSIEGDGADGNERRSGDWIMCLNRTEGTMKTYPWTTTNVKQKFELVPWRKQKRQLDIINYTAWEPDELSDLNGLKARRYKQHPPPAAHNQEIRRLIRLRFIFSMELQHQKQMKMLAKRGNKLLSSSEGEEEGCVITPRQFERILSGDTLSVVREVDKDSGACDVDSNSDNPKELASNFVGYFGSQSCVGSGKQQNHSLDINDKEVAEHCMSDSDGMCGFNYSDWLACCDSFKCSVCKRYAGLSLFLISGDRTSITCFLPIPLFSF